MQGTRADRGKQAGENDTRGRDGEHRRMDRLKRGTFQCGPFSVDQQMFIEISN